MALDFNLLRPAGGSNPVNAFLQGQQDVARNALAQEEATQNRDLNALRRQQVTGQIQAQEDVRRKQTVAEKTAMFRERLLRAPDPNSAREVVKMQYADPDVGAVLSQGGTLEQALAEVPDDPVKFRTYRDQEAMGMADWIKSQMPKVTPTGDVYDPAKREFIRKPQPMEKPPAPPASVAEYERARTDPNFMRFLQERAEATRPPRADRAPRTQQTTLSDGSLGLVNMDTGAVTPITMAGTPVKGKPSPFAEKATAQKTQLGKDLDFAIKELGNITSDGGLIDQSTGSGAGRLIDLGARFGGKAMPGDIAIGKIAPVADLVLKMVPRFEGPQSDKDTASYKEAAGQLADATLPREVRKEAGKTVLRLMQQRKNQFRTKDMVEEDVGAAPAAGASNIAQERANANAAIAAGAPAAAVRQRFKQNTGQEL
jgi:hypothetical protein